MAALPVSWSGDVQSRFTQVELLVMRQEFIRAEEMLEQLIPDIRRKYGSGSDGEFLARQLLAQVHTGQGKYDEAEALFEELLVIREQSIGSAHPYLADTISHMGDMYLAAGKLERAEANYQQALGIWETAYGKNDTLFIPKVLEKLAVVAERLNDETRAQGYRQRGSNSVRLEQELTALNSEQSNLTRQGRFAEAYDVARRKLKLTMQIYGEGHLFVGVDYKELARLCVHLEKFTEAVGYYQKARLIWIKERGADHPGVKDIEKESGGLPQIDIYRKEMNKNDRWKKRENHD